MSRRPKCIFYPLFPPTPPCEDTAEYLVAAEFPYHGKGIRPSWIPCCHNHMLKYKVTRTEVESQYPILHILMEEVDE